MAFTLTPNDKTNILIIAFYRPPKSETEESFLKYLKEKILEYEGKTTDTIVVCDLNYNMLDNNNKLHEFLKTESLTNTIKERTRLNHLSNNSTLLDMILSYLLATIFASISIPVSFSDHSLIMTSFKFEKNENYNAPFLDKEYICNSKF
jgi:hypothetical protein